MAIDLLHENSTFIDQARIAMRDGTTGLSDFPRLIECILRDGRWRQFRIKTGAVVEHRRFEDFVVTKPLEGLGSDIDFVKRLCGNERTIVDLIDLAEQNPGGRPKETVDNINGKATRPDGTSAQHAIRRLRKDRPDLHARVMTRELSPNAAMIEAGFRLPTITVPAVPADAGRRLARHFTPEQFAELAEAFRAAREAMP